MRSQLTGCRLLGANLKYSNLSAAHLNGANLTQADLQCANLQHANLRGAKLIRADVRGANLQDINLTTVSLEEALYDKHTQFPLHFVPASAGMLDGSELLS